MLVAVPLHLAALLAALSRALVRVAEVGPALLVEVAQERPLEGQVGALAEALGQLEGVREAARPRVGLRSRGRRSSSSGPTGAACRKTNTPRTAKH